ncbi:hypothetical protein LFYK43_06610 [Ligilactobacillus salitolerans]|uniref:Transcobalamin-like C-terminal domain-containing protein n=1 Tax=Ligilactobacillus salitolerans TaxID=1808352 RepID=A0A401IRP0_9LACO|nr:DUF4430 domain-containing protein [Ligilactobacillus salitolerans]GBG94202.1 hypothetical protein LFYK43_06610 [Ligilactobacillus salitolerans]
MNKKIVLVMGLLMALLLTGCANTGQEQDPNQARVVYQLKSGDKKLAQKKITVEKGSKVVTGLKKAWSVKLQNGMVTQIDGHAQDPDRDRYWTYEINGKEAKKGVNQQKVYDQDKIVFTLKDISQ